MPLSLFKLPNVSDNGSVNFHTTILCSYVPLARAARLFFARSTNHIIACAKVCSARAGRLIFLALSTNHIVNLFSCRSSAVFIKFSLKGRKLGY